MIEQRWSISEIVLMVTAAGLAYCVSAAGDDEGDDE